MSDLPLARRACVLSANGRGLRRPGAGQRGHQASSHVAGSRCRRVSCVLSDGTNMGAVAAKRCVEWLLGLYFVSHIPITLFIDLQVVLPAELYPQEVRAHGSPTCRRGSRRLGA